jgi:hypothetical protein
MTIALSCEVDGLVNDNAYTFTVRALSGAGWGVFSPASEAVTPSDRPTISILISGSRAEVRGRKGVIASGSTAGFGMGGVLRPWLCFPGRSAFTQGARSVLIDSEGDFTWQRRTSKKMMVYRRTLMVQWDRTG